MKEDLIFKEEAYQIVGACLAVYKNKGHGFLESVYQDCMEIELNHRAIPYDAKRNLELTYRGKVLRHSCVPDLICFDKIIVELKAVQGVADEHRAQVLNYLKATGFSLGLLVNFGCHSGLQWQRLIVSSPMVAKDLSFSEISRI